MHKTETFESQAHSLSNVPTARELGYPYGELVTVDLFGVVELGVEGCHATHEAWLCVDSATFVRDVESHR